MKFSKKKFEKLSAPKQIKKYLDFIRAIEVNWENNDQRDKLILEFNSCLKFSNDHTFQSLTIKSNTLREFFRSTAIISKEFGSDLRDQDMIIHTNDGRREQQKKPIYLVLDELRSTFNIGSIFRSAECFGIEEIILIGYSAQADNPKVEKTSMGTAQMVKSKHFETINLAIKYLKGKGVKIYAMETVENSANLEETELDFPAAFILGNEALGLAKTTLQLADQILQISLSGWKNSLNVGVTAAICCFEANKQLQL